jgi:hypothetical protein
MLSGAVREGRGHKIRRVVFALAIGAVIAAALSSGAAAAASPSALQISVADGYDGSMPEGAWVPVEVTITNHGAAFDGNLVVAVASPTGGGGQNCVPSGPSFVACGGPSGFPQGPVSSVTYHVPVEVAPATTKHIEVDVVAESGPVRVNLVTGGGSTVATGSTTVGIVSGSQPTSVAVISDSDSTLESFGEVTIPGGNQVQVVHLAPAAVPTLAALLGGFRAVAIDNASTQPLSTQQTSALSGYVHGGGTLIVFGGVEGVSTVRGLPPQLLPAQVSDASPFRLPRLASYLGVARLTGTAEVSALAPRGGHITLGEHGIPLVVGASEGAGQVMMVAFDPSAPPFAGWLGTPVLMRQFLTSAAGLSPSVDGGNSSSGVVTFPMGDTWAASGAERAASSVGDVVASIPSFSLPSSTVLALLLVGYVLLVGPVNFFVLARLRRRELGWITVPVLSVCVGLIAYGSGLGASHSLSLTEVRVVALNQSSGAAEVDSVGAMYLPHGGAHRVDLTDGSLVTALGLDTDSPTIDAATPGVILRGGSSSVSGYAASRPVQVSGSINARLTDSGGTITGVVVNNLPSGLSDAVLVGPSGATEDLGRVPAGATARVRMSPNSSSGLPGGPPAGYMPVNGSVIGNLVSGANFSGGFSGNARQEIRRQEALMGLVGLAMGNVSSGPVLVALTDKPMLPADVHAAGMSVTDLDGVVVQLAAPPATASGLRALGGVLVDETKVSGQSAGQVALDQGGTAVFRFDLPGTSWSRLAVTFDPLSFAGSPIPVQATGDNGASPSGGPYSVEIYDPATGAWQAVGTASSVPSTVSIPADVSPGGTVTVRVRAGTRGVTMSDTPTLDANPSGGPE